VGGLGSGNRCRWDRKSYIEDYPSLDIRQLHRRLRRGDELAADIQLAVMLSLLVNRPGAASRDAREKISLAWTSCHFGGQRPWFLCPGCGRRAAVLIAAEALLCRHCLGLTYRCQSESKLDRGHRRVRKIRERLGEKEWAKPKGMHRITFDRLRTRLYAAETILERAFADRVAGFMRIHLGNRPPFPPK